MAPPHRAKPSTHAGTGSAVAGTEGDPADFVVHDRDPRDDVGVLLTPDKMLLRGRVR